MADERAVRGRGWTDAPTLDRMSLVPVDLTIAKTDVPAAAASVPGTAITYTITVTNLGPSAVNAVTLTDNPAFLLPGLTFSP